MQCENPRLKQHLKAFLKKYPTVSKDVEFTIIDVNPQDWIADIKHEETNTAKSCQMCSIQEDIKRVNSSGWTGQPDGYNPFEWKVRY